MSRTRYKIEITYDDHYGNLEFDTYRDGWSHQTLYMCENNSSDYITVVDENGDYANLIGPDEYIELLCKAITSRDCLKENTITHELGSKVVITPISYNDYPEKVKEILK